MKLKRRMAFPLLLGASGIAALCSLGIWQVQRLEWKTGVIAEIDARIADPPSQLPRSPQRELDNFRPVTAAGEILDSEIFVLLSRQGFGPGFRVIAPFETGGRRILADRGFVPQSQRAAQRQTGAFEIAGNLHWPDETDALFTPEPEGDLWFARDVDAMAQLFGAEPVMIVVRDSSPAVPEIVPWPVDSSGIPNNHRNYAVTWFLLASAWFGMTVLWIWRISREPDS